MDENNNLNGTDSGQPQNEYTGEYGNSVETDGSADSVYSYSYKKGANNAESTHSGDYYAGNNNAESTMNDSRQQGYQSSNDTQNGFESSYRNENPYQKANPYETNMNNNYNNTNPYGNNGGNGQSYSFNDNEEKNKSSKKDDKKSSLGKKLLICAACALVFGIVAAVCFESVCYFSRKVLGINTPAITTSKQIGTTTTGSSKKVATGAAIAGGTNDVSSIVEQTMPAVVAITCTSEATNYYSLFGNSQQQEQQSSGTGFIIGQSNSELLIATNNHVIDGAKTISVQFIDEQVYEASVKGKDSSNDLAVVAVKLKKIKKSTMNKIKIADVGDSDSLKVGEMAVAIGNSLGYGQSVTVGYISAKNREITETSETDGSTNSIKAIQTDAAINPGNSGGPLINLKGEVIGINSAKIADSSVEGVGYAIPISQATPIIDELKDKEELSDSQKGYLGISGRTVGSEASSYNIPSGVYVAEVSKGGAAEEGGIKVGDIITAINNQDVRSIESLKEKANGYRKGTEVELTIQRSDNGTYKEKKVKVKLQGSKSLDGLSNGSGSDSSNNDSNNGSNGYNQGNGNSGNGSNGYDNNGNSGSDNGSDSGDDSGFGNFFSNPFGN